MKRKLVAIQADPLETLKLGSDTSLYLATEFSKQGYDIFFYTPDALTMRDDGQFEVSGVFVEVVFENHASRYTIRNSQVIDLRDACYILVRQNPPFDMTYITTTYLLELLQIYGVTVLNHPTAIRSESEKLSVFKFPDFLPPSLIAAQLNAAVVEFVHTHQTIVIKPLYWFGGKFVEKIEAHQEGYLDLIQSAFQQHGHIVLQKFLPDVYDGDKRVIMINGKIAGALKRIPAAGKFVANLAAGGTAACTELTPREVEIAETVGGYLKTQGILLAGLDLIGEHLNEINVTSPTGLVALEKLYGLNLAQRFVDGCVDL